MNTTLTIIDVFDVSFTDGVMVIADRDGHFTKGDPAWVEAADGTVSSGEIGMLDSTRKDDAPENRLGVEIRGPLAETVKAGDRVATSRPSAIPRAGGPEA